MPTSMRLPVWLLGQELLFRILVLVQGMVRVIHPGGQTALKSRGAFGNVIVFDEYFAAGLRLAEYATSCDKNLKKILEFYDARQTEIESHKLRTMDFLTGHPAEIPGPAF
jgi:hypothetical protein